MTDIAATAPAHGHADHAFERADRQVDVAHDDNQHHAGGHDGDHLARHKANFCQSENQLLCLSAGGSCHFAHLSRCASRPLIQSHAGEPITSVLGLSALSKLKYECELFASNSRRKLVSTCIGRGISLASCCLAQRLAPVQFNPASPIHLPGTGWACAEMKARSSSC